jgi:hypothetical protein
MHRYTHYLKTNLGFEDLRNSKILSINNLNALKIFDIVQISSPDCSYIATKIIGLDAQKIL